MDVHVETRSPQATEVRELVVRRMRFVMRRLTWLAPKAKVYLSDVNGPRGGINKRVHIELKALTRRPIVITALAKDWRSAVDNALSRAARALIRNWRRDQTRTRRHQPAAGEWTR